MMNLTYDGTFDLGAGTLASLVTSGRLELIDAKELRDRLAGWQSLMDDVVDNEIIMKTFIATVLVPVMASKGLQVGRGRSRDPEAHSRTDSVGPHLLSPTGSNGPCSRRGRSGTRFPWRGELGGARLSHNLTTGGSGP